MAQRRVQLNTPKIKADLLKNREVAFGISGVAGQVVNEAKKVTSQLGRIDTGEYIRGIETNRGRQKPPALQVVAKGPVARWLEFGTGIYGPRRRPITPVKASRLVWQDKTGHWHSATSVRGQRPSQIMRLAMMRTATRLGLRYVWHPGQ